ncbi:glycoside hydrolase family 3 N-terminal domain-containing protein [Caulobacter segnis]
MDAQIDRADLRESDLLAFQIAIEKSHPASVMCAYNKVNGDWACQNDFLLNKVLKRDWNYPGWVMSDWGAAHSTVKAALAGLDQRSGQELDEPDLLRRRPEGRGGQGRGGARPGSTTWSVASCTG